MIQALETSVIEVLPYIRMLNLCALQFLAPLPEKASVFRSGRLDLLLNGLRHAGIFRDTLVRPTTEFQDRTNDVVESLKFDKID